MIASSTCVRAIARCAVIAALSLPALAAASHYRLPAAGLVTDAEHDALSAAEVTTTLHLFRHAAKTSDRARLSRATGISMARLTELARLVDLMRVRGIGPSMADLLTKAGVPHSRALRETTPDALAERLDAANRTHRIAPVAPDAGVVTDWIDAAKRLAQALEVDG